jgi:hypothetical protein
MHTCTRVGHLRQALLELEGTLLRNILLPWREDALTSHGWVVFWEDWNPGNGSNDARTNMKNGAKDAC